MNIKDLWEKYRIYGFAKFFTCAYYELKWNLVNKFLCSSYSQMKEDVFIDSIVKGKKDGFYVDIGANHPTRFSNTMRFYKRGWHGINVEPNFRNYKVILAARPRDINLNLGIAEQKGDLTFYSFVPDTLSTFSREESQSYVADGYRLIEEKKIPVDSLSSVFDTYCKNVEIDFITIDTEGYDLQVLKSSDWKKWRPRIVCIESSKHSISGKAESKSTAEEDFLGAQGYSKIYDNGLNSIYVDRSSSAAV